MNYNVSSIRSLIFLYRCLSYLFMAILIFFSSISSSHKGISFEFFILLFNNSFGRQHSISIRYSCSVILFCSFLIVFKYIIVSPYKKNEINKLTKSHFFTPQNDRFLSFLQKNFLGVLKIFCLRIVIFFGLFQCNKSIIFMLTVVLHLKNIP